MFFSFFAFCLRRLEARTIRHGGDLWPLHTPGAIEEFRFLIAD